MAASFRIRKPGITQITLKEYEEFGAFEHINKPRAHSDYSDDHLIELYRAKRWKEFFIGIIKARKNIMISAGTNAGKTTWLNGMLQHIDPHERIVTIEDTREIRIPSPERGSPALFTRRPRSRQGDAVRLA